MVHVVFDTNTVSLGDFIQTGGGGGSTTYFEGVAPYQRGRGALLRQRGAGVGAILRGLWRTLLPVLKSVGASVTQEGIATGSRILSNLAQGSNLKDTLVSEGKAGVSNLAEKFGPNQQTGRGYKRSRSNVIRRQIHASDSIVGKSIPPLAVAAPLSRRKRSRKDTFGLF